MKYTAMGLATLTIATVGVAAGGRAGEPSLCDQTARDLLSYGLVQAEADYILALARASTFVDEREAEMLAMEAGEALEEDTDLAWAQFDARVDLCELLGESQYDPQIDPADFLHPDDAAKSPNPYFPLVPGTMWTYEGETDEGESEVIQVVVTEDTKEILGVACFVVNDTVWIDGEIVEDTDDWFAQDKAGNVWYFGEITFNFEDGEIVDIEGSWEAGVDGAKPGYVMLADPFVGAAYRQELLLAEAEDAGEVIGAGVSVRIGLGLFDNCLQTRDFTPIEPEGLEHKYYAPGVGFILEVKPETGETVELVSMTTVE